jgi:hypothetical protein
MFKSAEKAAWFSFLAFARIPFVLAVEHSVAVSVIIPAKLPLHTMTNGPPSGFRHPANSKLRLIVSE